MFRGTTKGHEHDEKARDINFINKLRDSYRHPYLKRKPLILDYTRDHLNQRNEGVTPGEDTY